MSFFEALGLTTYHDVLDALAAALDGAGWTVTDLAPSAAAPSGAGGDVVGRAFLAIAPDTEDHPGGHALLFYRYRDASTGTSAQNAIGIVSATGGRAIPLAGAARVLATVAVATASAHDLATGDLVALFGTTDTALHEGWPAGNGGETAPNTITVTGASNFTYTSNTSGTIGAATGGYAVVLYNPAGAICGRTSGARSTPAIVLAAVDDDCAIYGWVDAQRICGVVVSADRAKAFYAGLAQRRHIQADASSVGRLAAQVVGDGTAQALTLDRPCPDFYVGQPLWLVDQTKARPDATAYWSSLHTGAIDAVNSETEIEFAVPNGVTYPAGTIVGWDPCPLVALGDPSATQNSLTITTARMTHYNGGTRVASPIGVDVNPAVSNNSSELATDPDSASFYRGGDLWLNRTTSPEGVVGPLFGLACVSLGAQAALDIHRGGNPANAPAADYAVFPASLASTYAVMVGPEATPTGAGTVRPTVIPETIEGAAVAPSGGVQFTVQTFPGESTRIRLNFIAPVVVNNALRCIDTYVIFPTDTDQDDRARLACYVVQPSGPTTATHVDLTIDEMVESAPYDVTISVLEYA